MLVVTIISSLLTFTLGYLYFLKSRDIQELKQKTDFALSGKSLTKIEFSASDKLGQVAQNFNKLGQQYQQLRKELEEVENLKNERKSMGEMVKSVEQTLNQVNLINDIGRKITSSLDVNNILKQITDIIYSTTKTTEIHYLIKTHATENHYICQQNQLTKINGNNWLHQPNNIINWSFENNKEVLLHDAIADFGQYVFSPVIMYNGIPAQSVLVVSFRHNPNVTGCIALFEGQKNAYNKYILDFITSITTYLSVGLDNSKLYSELESEKTKSEELLLNILPKKIAEELKDKGKTEPKFHEAVTVMFTDFKEFTKLSEQFSTSELVNEIDHIFKNFDDILLAHGVEKIKTIGDAYMCVSGLNNESNHAMQVVKAAQEIKRFMLEYMRQRNVKNEKYFEARIGIHSGNVVSGVVGKSKFAFDIWGDTVNTASRMETSSEANRINISGTTYQLVKEQVHCIHRGKIDAKNKGQIDMYFVED